MVIDLHAKNQVDICKPLGKKYGKLKLRTDRWTDALTECIKPEVPFGFTGRGLISIKLDLASVNIVVNA